MLVGKEKIDKITCSKSFTCKNLKELTVSYLRCNRTCSRYSGRGRLEEDTKHKTRDWFYETLQDHCLTFALYGVVEKPPPSITLVKLVRGVSNLSIGPLSNSA